jgi:peptide/nickel transport system permease protein
VHKRSLPIQLGRLVVTVWLIVTIAFFCAYRLPGDPARLILGQKATEESLAQFRRSMGLDRPIAVQYALFLRRSGQLDFGNSLVQRRPVLSLIRERALQTLLLVTISLLVLTLAGFIVPVALELIPNRLFSRVYQRVWTVLAVAPPYVLAVIALLCFAGWFRWVPVIFHPEFAGAWVLPSLVLAAYPVAVTTRLLINEIEDALESPYVRTARAFGYTHPTIVVRFALPNALTPALAAFANGLAYFVTGTFFVEVVFGIGGIGTLAYEAVRNKDIPVLIGLSIVFAVAICLISVVLQLLLVKLDPRMEECLE